MKQDNAPFGVFRERLRDLREARGLTQEEIGSMLKISSVGYGGWERGDSEPSIDNIIRLCGILECSSDSLLGISECRKTLSKKEMESLKERAKKDVLSLFALIDAIH